MTISRFSYKEKWGGWKLNEVSFSDFNLLVGKSGAGKTKLLRAIETVCQAGTSGVLGLRSLDWEIELVSGEDRYKWKAETETGFRSIKAGGAREEVDAKFLSENITKNDNELLIRRDGAKFIFNGRSLPKLDRTGSAVSLLRDEESILPIYNILSRFVFSQALDHNANRWKMRIDSESIEKWRKRFSNLDDLRAATAIPLVAKIYLLQKDFPDEFDRLTKEYSGIFTTVSDIKVDIIGLNLPSEAEHPREMMGLFIKEKGVKIWVRDLQISGGMLRTLIHLFEVALAPSGSVIIIDEIENSMGINCLPQLIDYLLRRSDLQFILTSHHPYVINNIPWKYWKLVTRKGSEVTVKDATSIPVLNAASSLEKFTQLLNLEEYQEAIR